MRKRIVRAFAPATIANLGPGFDVLGLAIDRPGDFVTAARQLDPSLTFSVRGKERTVPSDARKNVASFVAQLMLDEFKPPFGIQLVLDKRMPIGSGLGSSAASSVAAAAAVNALLPKPLKRHELLRFAIEGERLASGAMHADNVAPSLLGGACLVRSYDPLEVVRIPVRNTIFWVVVHPHMEVRTEEARNILPTSVPLEKAIHHWGNVAGLTIGLSTGDAALVGRCVADEIVEPVRSSLIPGFHDVKKAALAAGATGCSISGSGPSLFAVAPSRSAAKKIGAAMKRQFATSSRVACDVYLSRVNMEGTRVGWRQ
ncbi:MAG: homoserine kinase [Ignavibacteria bacterium]|nr:homoserine kinase [Ignavibacteria bacterium]